MRDIPIQVFCQCAHHQIKTVYMVHLDGPSETIYACNGCDDVCGRSECMLCLDAMNRIFQHGPKSCPPAPFLPSAEAPPPD